MYTIGEYIRLKKMEAIARKVKESQPIVKTVIKAKNIKLKIHDN